MTMHYRRDQGHDACKHLRSRRQAELVDRLSHAKPQVRILEIVGHHPISGTERLENRLGSVHVETGDIHPAVEAREVNHRTPPTGDLGSHKETAVEAWGRRCKLDCLLLLHSLYCSGNSQPTDGSVAVARQREQNRKERGL